jgi:hypothetical protein
MNPPAERPEPKLPPVLETVLRGQLSVYGACAVAAAVFVILSYWLKAHHAPFWLVMAAALAFGGCLLIIVWAFARRGCGVAASPAKRRYQRRILAAMGAYVLILVGVIGAFIRLHPAGAVAYALAIAPAIPVVVCIVVMGLYLRDEPDEFERAVQMQGALLATGGALALATAWGFLEMFHLVPHVESWALFPVWGALLGPAQAFARRRYQ